MKRRLTAVLAACALLLALGAPAATAQEEEFILSEGILVRYLGSGGDVVIPDGVTSIADEAFAFTWNLRSVRLPDTLLDIGNYAFTGCMHLEGIDLPAGVRSIGEYAFSDCVKIPQVTIPGGVETVSPYAFYNCASLEKVTLQPGVKRVDEEAFGWCAKMKEITIPASVESVASSAFEGCTTLQTIYGEPEPTPTPTPTPSVSPSAVPTATPSAKPTATPRPTNKPSGGDWSGESATPTPKPSPTPTPTPTAVPSPTPSAGPVYVSLTAYVSTQSVEVDGKAVNFQMYALRDSRGYDTNYVKLRDVAYVLNGTPAQFSVDWDGVVRAWSGRSYTPNGSEMTTPFQGDRGWTRPEGKTWINGSPADLDAILLKDERGGGYTYYKLRDLGKALGFNVSWDEKRGVYLETDKPYQEEK